MKKLLFMLALLFCFFLASCKVTTPTPTPTPVDPTQQPTEGKTEGSTQGGDENQPTQGGNENQPTQGGNENQPTQGGSTTVDPNAPKLGIGWNDTGYKTTESNGVFTIKKSASAGQWEGATK